MTKARELADLAGSSGGGIDVEAERLNQVIQSIPGAEGFDWSAGMAFDVVDAVPADIDGKVGDVVFIPGGPGGLPVSGGKVLQVVRVATDNTKQTTNSTSFEDITGLSVTISPTKASSSILLLGVFRSGMESSLTTNLRANARFVDSSDNSVGGTIAFGMQNFDRAGGVTLFQSQIVGVAYSTPSTTSATTYKMQMTVSDTKCLLEIRNNNQPGQMYAIELEDVVVSP